jgi:hypothetical protein
MGTVKRHERIAGIFLIIVGIATAIYSYYELKLGEFRHPDSGFLPFWCGLALIIFSIVWIKSNWGPVDNPVPFWEKSQWIKPLIAVVAMLVYGWSMEGIGYLLSTFIFLLAWEAIIEREKWFKTLVISIVGTTVMYFLFERMLGVPLPPGVFAL